MEITTNVRAFLLQMPPSYDTQSDWLTEWPTLRRGEIASSDSPLNQEQHCIPLRQKLLKKLEGYMLGRMGRNLNVSLQTNVINDAFINTDYGMLSFFNRLMSPDHGADLLRVVFVHAVNFGVPLDLIDSDAVEAYRLVTKGRWSEFDTFVRSVSAEDSSKLINMVLSDPKCARIAIAYAHGRGLDSPQALIDILSSEPITPALVTGSL